MAVLRVLCCEFESVSPCTSLEHQERLMKLEVSNPQQFIFLLLSAGGPAAPHLLAAARALQRRRGLRRREGVRGQERLGLAVPRPSNQGRRGGRRRGRLPRGDPG